jgi:hypothetical protein
VHELAAVIPLIQRYRRTLKELTCDTLSARQLSARASSSRIQSIGAVFHRLGRACDDGARNSFGPTACKRFGLILIVLVQNPDVPRRDGALPAPYIVPIRRSCRRPTCDRLATTEHLSSFRVR